MTVGMRAEGNRALLIDFGYMSAIGAGVPQVTIRLSCVLSGHEPEFTLVGEELRVCIWARSSPAIGSRRVALRRMSQHKERVMLRGLPKMINSVNTANRRIDHPERRRGDLVLDLGGDDSPYPGAHVVCDYCSDDLERGVSFFLDRPFVSAAAEMPPFKDKAFDYSIASHILEHVDDPASVLNELSRVSRAGYIEAPSAFHEFAVPYPTHVSRCSIVDGKFVVVMKDSWNQQLDARYFDLQNELRTAWRRLADLDALGVQTRYRWRDHIEFEVHGMVMFDKSVEVMESVRIELRHPVIRRLIIKLVYALMKPRPFLDLSLVLACPLCHRDLELNRKYEAAICSACSITYPRYRGYLDRGYLDFRLMRKETYERVDAIVQE